MSGIGNCAVSTHLKKLNLLFQNGYNIVILS